MPSCEVDAELLGQVRRFMKVNNLSISGAAARLGVDRTTFWRFCYSGRARNDTRALYRETLNKCSGFGVSVADGVAESVVDAGVPAVQGRSGLQRLPTDRELKRIRKACEGVLALLDAYEAQQLAGKLKDSAVGQ